MIKKKVSSSKGNIQDKIKAMGESPLILSMLAWGRSGTGKTAFSSTFPKPCLLLDIQEKGTDTVSNVKQMDMINITQWSEVEEVYWYLKSGKSGYKSVVLDQITQLQELALNKVTGGSNMVSKRAFGEASGLMKTWLLNYRNLIEDGIHVCFIAHDRTTDGGDDEDDQIDPSVGPRLMPSLASFVTGAVSVIGNTYIKETFSGKNNKDRNVEYGMRIGPHAYYTTKVRHPVGVETPDAIPNPTFDKIISIVKGEYSSKNPEVNPTKSIRRKLNHGN